MKASVCHITSPPSSGFILECGDTIVDAQLAYETYGELSERGDNAVLVFHALSGSQHASGYNPHKPPGALSWPPECHTGWWDAFIGPGRAIDTNHFYVVCANYLGGCYGSTGPASPHPSDGKPYGSRFPSLSIGDIVNAQVALLDQLGIKRLHALVGPSLGGMMALDFAVRFPDRVQRVALIGTAHQVSVLYRIQTFEQICAIENDPHFRGGDYYDGPWPQDGLALARMIAHKSYVSLTTIAERARREVSDGRKGSRRYELAHPIESYMLHQGTRFVERFDPNTYLTICIAAQQFDLARSARVATVQDALRRCSNKRFLVFSVDSDVCFYPEEQSALVQLLKANQATVTYITVHSDKGHDSFLLEPHLFGPHLSYLLMEQ